MIGKETSKNYSCLKILMHDVKKFNNLRIKIQENSKQKELKLVRFLSLLKRNNRY